MLSSKVELKCSYEEKNYPTGVTQAMVDKVGPVNNFMHSMFSQLDVFLNHTNVSASSGLYRYRAYFETLLNYGPSAKQSHLGSVCWSDDTAGSMSNLDDANEGLVKRRQLFVNNKVDMIGHLHHDIFNQDRVLSLK